MGTEKLIDAAEVAKHSTPESCWVILYGEIYDVTDFLPEHPGGSKIILSLAGKDATEEYDPVHPPGTLEENLRPEAKIGSIDPKTMPKPQAENKAITTTTTSSKSAESEGERQGPPSMESLLNLEDIEKEATRQASKKAWAYYYSAADDLFSKTFNNTVYRQILLRPRIFIDCERCDLSTTILGNQLNTPIYVSPAAMARLVHPTGEAGIAAACAKFGAMQIISNNASMTPEQIVKDAVPGQTFGWQLYVQTDTKKSEDMIARINKLSDKIKFICLTLDAPVPGKREHDERSKNVAENLPITSAVQTGQKRKEESGGIGKSLFAGTSPNLTWKRTLPWLARNTNLPIVLKGLQTHEDAYIAAQYAPQIKGIILSNHGGRAVDTAPPAVHTLLEIRKYCPEVFSKIDVLVDGGIRRGTDVVKALCLGARGVGIGRAALWGLGAGGPEGVERTFQILEDETKTAMRLLGVEAVDRLGMKHINARAVEQQIYDGPAGFEKLALWMKTKL